MHISVENDNLINQCISLHVGVQSASRLLERQEYEYKNIIRSIYKSTDALIITTCQYCIEQHKVHHK